MQQHGEVELSALGMGTYSIHIVYRRIYIHDCIHVLVVQ
jgi:hypothetical protein